MSRKRLKQYLMLLAVVGLIAIAADGGGTFASFNAEVTNNNNAFATGSLLLHDTHGTTTCTSEADSGNANNLATNGCATLFSISDLTPSVPQYADLQLTNAGTLPATDIKFDVPAGCTDSSAEGNSTLSQAIAVSDTVTVLHVATLTGSFADGDPIIVKNGSDQETFTADGATAAGSTTVNVVSQAATAGFPITTTTVAGPTFGTATLLCGNLELSIIETDLHYGHASGTPALGCAFGTADGTTSANGCKFAGSANLAGVTDTGGPPVPLTNAATLTLAASTANGANAIAAGGSRYFVIGVEELGSADNTAQNRAASFALRWHIDA